MWWCRICANKRTNPTTTCRDSQVCHSTMARLGLERTKMIDPEDKYNTAWIALVDALIELRKADLLAAKDIAYNAGAALIVFANNIEVK